MAPSERVLESVQVSRAQTSYQLFSLVERVRQLAQDDTALLVASVCHRFYRDHDRDSEDGPDGMLRSRVRGCTPESAHQLIPSILRSLVYLYISSRVIVAGDRNVI
jgi:hypothetical protein